MADLFTRFDNNPLVTPEDVRPSREDFVVECVLNPGVFRHDGRTGLLLRVAERPEAQPGWVSTAVADPDADGGMRTLHIRRDDPRLKFDDPRVFDFDGQTYLSTLSHLRLAWSSDGRTFVVEPGPALVAHRGFEEYGVEDARVSQLGDGTYAITYTAASGAGVAGALRETRDWKTFTPASLILPADNKDIAIFEETIAGRYWCMHRPMCSTWGGLSIWTASSPDRMHWGRHGCLARARAGMWDSGRVGAGAAPIRTDAGWLEIYHGCDGKGRYCLGALLLDLNDPSRVLARSREPIMEPREGYERKGFYSECVFTNGHTVDGDRLTIYYGASDTVVCGATASIREILASLG